MSFNQVSSVVNFCFELGKLKNEIPVAFLSLLTKQKLLPEQPKAVHFLSNELPVRLIITGNLWVFQPKSCFQKRDKLREFLLEVPSFKIIRVLFLYEHIGQFSKMH